MSFKFVKTGRWIWSVTLMAALSLGANAFGQVQDGHLVGSILHSTGAAIPNAKVEAENTATGVKVSTTSGADGFYRLNNLLAGTYKVTGSATGLTSSTRQVAVEANQTLRADVTLSVSGVTQEVEVV